MKLDKLKAGATPQQLEWLDRLKAEDILQRLEWFRKLARKSTDEIGWIALAYSCSRDEADKMIQAATTNMKPHHEDLEMIKAKITEALEEAWDSEGGFWWCTNRMEESNGPQCYLFLWPTCREIIGGPKHGSRVHERFRLDVNALMRIFDERPRILFDSSHGECGVPNLELSGTIGGVRCKVLIVSSPAAACMPQDRIYVSDLEDCDDLCVEETIDD